MNNVKIIAEAGVNHNGKVSLARKLIEVASQSGADAVKFQTFLTDATVTKHAEKAEYQKSYDKGHTDQFSMIKNLELSFDDFSELNEYAKELSIQFLSTAFDLESLNYLESINLPLHKVASGEITNLPYLRQVGSKGKPVILSSGMSTMREIACALEVLEESGVSRSNVTVLHCNTAYPTPMEDVNLNAMASIRNELGVNVGYSDHTMGIEVPIAAVAMGAKILEKHFTLDCSMPGPDHAASLEPEGLKEMVASIRNIERALGNGIKVPSSSERKNTSVIRKSIVARKSILKGENFSEQNLAVKRPGTGICPMRWDDVIGKNSSRDYKKDELIQE
jgi:N,N'-diacetyllegionaminate synthase